MSTREVLMQLDDRRVRVRAEGEQLHYSAPKGTMTPDLRGTLSRHKPGLIRLLHRGEVLLGMTLRQFENARCCLEVKIPGLTPTLWFVSGPDGVERLRMEGIPQGRILTAAELRNLLTAPEVTHEDVLSIVRGKLMFCAEVVDVRQDVSQAEPDMEVEPTQCSLDLGTTTPPGVQLR